jgi:hypothetical protein
VGSGSDQASHELFNYDAEGKIIDSYSVDADKLTPYAPRFLSETAYKAVTAHKAHMLN